MPAALGIGARSALRFFTRSPPSFTAEACARTMSTQNIYQRIQVPAALQNLVRGNTNDAPSTVDCQASCIVATVLTWNVLAQCMIKRALFPSASKDALRWPLRSENLTKHITELSPDIMALQEVDEVMELWNPLLKRLGYEYRHMNKDRGRHGCLIGWRSEQYEFVDSDFLCFDSSPLITPTVLHPSTGNIALVIKLRHKETGRLLVITNHHLYWVPKGSYLRLRQLYVLFEAIMKINPNQDPVLMCGDFNGLAERPEYAVLTGRLPLTKKLQEDLEDIHDPREDPRKITTGRNFYKPAHEFGPGPLWKAPPGFVELSPNDLVAKFKAYPRCHSCYSRYTRLDADHPKRADCLEEPSWTTLTECFSGVLDYIHVIDPRYDHMGDETEASSQKFRFRVSELLKLPTPKELLPGIPNDVHPSDHVPIMAKLRILP